MSHKFKYDVFLSHSSKDKAIVRDLAEKLKADGIRVWFDEWAIGLGDSIPSKIDEGLENSRILILAMSGNAFGSDWVSLEHNTIMFRDPLNKNKRFIPILLEDCEIRSSIKQFAYLDWRSQTEENYQRLLSTIREHTESKAPETKVAAIIESKGEKIEKIKETKSTKILEDHSREVNSVAISVDNKFIVSGSSDSSVRIWETDTGKCLKVFRGHSSFVWGVAISNDNRFVVSQF